MSTLSATILVVDDTPANIGVLIEALADASYEVLVAETGASAISQLGHVIPDLILLDVIMPGIDGFATCARIKAKENLADIPVLFMTSLDDPAEKVRAFEVGAVDYIVKPVHVPEVLARVRAHLEIRRLQRSLAEELALRLDAENQLRLSLDRAVLVVDESGRIAFSTRLAEHLLHQHCADYTPGQLPASLTATPGGPLMVRRFSEPGGREHTMLLLEERVSAPSPTQLLNLGLTTREAEVLFWVAQGKSNPDIATILNAGLRTIHKHVENIFRKLGCETRAAAAITAQDFLRR